MSEKSRDENIININNNDLIIRDDTLVFIVINLFSNSESERTLFPADLGLWNKEYWYKHAFHYTDNKVTIRLSSCRSLIE